MDAQFIDVDTCEPVPNVMWDVWHCNATGVYAGVVATGNGNGDEDPTNLNNTFLRGLQPSDGDGVAQFLSIFPGHYSGRATHIHVVAHTDGTVLANGTYTGGTVAHIGQIFFDQDLITEVNALEPYLSNTIAITENVDDRVVADEVRLPVTLSRSRLVYHAHILLIGRQRRRSLPELCAPRRHR